MAKPNLTVTVEPLEAGKLACLSIAPSFAGGPRSIKVIACLTITNDGGDSVTLDGVEFSFPGSAHDRVAMRGVKSYLIQTRAEKTAKLGAHETTQWSNGIVPAGDEDDSSDDIENMVFLSAPAPDKIKIAVSCEGFSDPVEVTLGVAEFTRPTAAGAFRFPFDADDLRRGEYFTASAKHWANGGLGGTQIFAHDIGVEGADFDGIGPASSLLSDRDGSKNEHWRIWGKPVRAMADGEVEAWLETTEENTVLGKFPKDPDESNHIWIKHGDEYVAYKHLQKGSIPNELKVKGKPVKAGDKLGLVGNSGNSTNPHTHLECHRDSPSGPLRPMPFRDGWVVSTAFPPHPNPASPWVELTADGISRDEVAIWPAARKPTWYPRTWGEVAHFGIPAASFQTRFDRVTSSGYRPIWFDVYHVGGDRYVNLIFRREDGTSWSARLGMTGAEYQAEFDEQKRKGRRLLNLTSYLGSGEILYGGIWVDGGGPAWRAYHAVSADDHQRRAEKLMEDGFRPVNVSVVSLLGIRTYAALYDQTRVGKFQLKSWVERDEYQALFDANDRADRTLAYINASDGIDSPHFAAVFAEDPPGPGRTSSRHGMTAAQLQREYDDQLDAGRLTICIAGYPADGGARYAAAWRKP